MAESSFILCVLVWGLFSIFHLLSHNWADSTTPSQGSANIVRCCRKLIVRQKEMPLTSSPSLTCKVTLALSRKSPSVPYHISPWIKEDRRHLLSSGQFKRHQLYAIDKRAGQSSRWLSIGIAPYLNKLGFHLLPKLNKHSFLLTLEFHQCMFSQMILQVTITTLSIIAIAMEQQIVSFCCVLFEMIISM
jgi:hypothetical protein